VVVEVWDLYVDLFGGVDDECVFGYFDVCVVDDYGYEVVLFGGVFVGGGGDVGSCCYGVVIILGVNRVEVVGLNG